MLIASKSDHDPMVHGVKSKIRKKNAGKSSSCPEYAQASIQIPREDQPMILGPDQTIGGIYRLFGKCSGGPWRQVQDLQTKCGKVVLVS